MANNKTWMPTTAGILEIIAGSFGVIAAGVLNLIAGITRFVPEVPRSLAPIFVGLSVPLAILGILAIVGGVYALHRKMWGLALAGSIGAFFTSWLLGIAAIVITAMSKDEFE